MEYEGLNAIGFWWKNPQNNPKQNRKKEKKKQQQPKNRTNNVLSISVQLWFSLLLDISLVFLASYHVYKTTTASLCSEINFLSWFFFPYTWNGKWKGKIWAIELSKTKNNVYDT